MRGKITVFGIALCALLILFASLAAAADESLANGLAETSVVILSLFVVLAIIGFLFLIGALFALIGFWIWMLVDCLERNFKDKGPWVVVMLLAGLVGSIIYYVEIKRKNEKDKPASKKRLHSKR